MKEPGRGVASDNPENFNLPDLRLKTESPPKTLAVDLRTLSSETFLQAEKCPRMKNASEVDK